MQESIVCPVCSLDMPLKTKKVDFQYKGNHFLIDYQHYHCERCNCDYTTEEVDETNLQQVYQAHEAKTKNQ